MSTSFYGGGVVFIEKIKGKWYFYIYDETEK